MGCQFDREKLTAYYDGECESAEGADVERHIASCSECLRELGEMKQTSASVKTLPRIAAPPSIMEAVQKEIRPSTSLGTGPAAPAPEFRQAPRQGSGQAPRGLQWIISVAAVALVAASVVVISNRQETAAPRLETPVAHEAPRNGPGRSGIREKTSGTTLLKDAPSMKPSAADSKIENGMTPDSLESMGGKDIEKQGGYKAEAPLAPIAKPVHPAEKSDDPAKETVLSEEKRHAAAESNDEDQKRKEKEADLQRARLTARGLPKAAASDKAPAVEVLAISAKDMARTRAGVEKLMEKLDRKIVVGSATLGDQAYVKDHYVEVELSEAEYQALVRDLQVQKAAYEKTDSEVEAKRLNEQLAKGYAKGLTEEAGAPADPAPAAAPEMDKKGEKKKEEGARPDAPAAPGAKAAGQSPPPDGTGGIGGGSERKTDNGKKLEPVRRKVIIAFREPVPAAKK